MAIFALVATSLIGSTGLELTNQPDDLLVGVGFTLLGFVGLAWLYGAARLYNHLEKIDKEETSEE